MGYGNYPLSSLLGKVLPAVVTDVKLLIWKKMCLVIPSQNFNNRPEAVRKEAIS